MRKNAVVHQDGRGSPVRRAAPVVALAVALAVAGCGRNGGELPADFAPVGVSGQDNVLLAEVGMQVVDSVTSVPVVNLRILDRTAADGYRLYRAVGAGGYDNAVDYVTNFVGTYNQGYETYQAVDRDWQTAQPRRYVGRATIGGRESQLSPLTNYATVPAGEAEDLLAGSFLTVCPIDTVKTDSLPTMVWEAVPGAARYLVLVLRTDGRIFFLGLTPPDGSASYRLGSRQGMIFQEQILTRSNYFWTVEAIDADSRIIAHSDRQIFECDPPEAKPPCTP